MRERELQTYRKEEEGDPDLGEGRDVVRIGDQPKTVRADQDAGEEKAYERWGPDPMRERDDRYRQANEEQELEKQAGVVHAELTGPERAPAEYCCSRSPADSTRRHPAGCGRRDRWHAPEASGTRGQGPM